MAVFTFLATLLRTFFMVKFVSGKYPHVQFVDKIFSGAAINNPIEVPDNVKGVAAAAVRTHLIFLNLNFQSRLF